MSYQQSINQALSVAGTIGTLGKGAAAIAEEAKKYKQYKAEMAERDELVREADAAYSELMNNPEVKRRMKTNRALESMTARQDEIRSNEEMLRMWEEAANNGK